MKSMKTREYVFDNAKGFLIFCVVLGHMLEGNLTGVSRYLYILIYSFHMPFFIFLSGYFAKYDAKKMLRKLVMPYLCLQWIACFAETIATGKQMSFTTPVWILWYLYALIVWKMLIPFITTEKMMRRLAIFVCSVAVALVAGFDSSIGYEMGLSRIVVFFPYFLLGYYLKDAERMMPKLYRLYKNLKKEHCLLFLLIIWLIVIFLGDKIDYRWLYGSYCYEALSYGPLQRAGLYLIGMGQIAALLKLMSRKETVLCRIGQKSMRIYLCHPVFVLALRSIFTGVPEAVVCAIVIVWGLSLDCNKQVEAPAAETVRT
jgi:fucose 4-O-acetylase-like acetyltransferase